MKDRSQQELIWHQSNYRRGRHQQWKKTSILIVRHTWDPNL